jgi:hypothetical protein
VLVVEVVEVVVEVLDVVADVEDVDEKVEVVCSHDCCKDRKEVG